MKQSRPPLRVLLGCLLAFTGLEISRAQTPVSGEPSPLRVAILSGRETQAEADLLSTQLSDRKGMILLERADLSAIAAEGSLISGKLPAFLESADALILVEEIQVHSDSYLATRIVGRDDGTVHASDLRARGSSALEWGNLLAQKLDEYAKRSKGGTEGVPTVAVRAIREEFVAARYRHFTNRTLGKTRAVSSPRSENVPRSHQGRASFPLSRSPTRSTGANPNTARSRCSTTTGRA
jgi:hypothetical protein